MATSGYTNAVIIVKVHMASALVVGAAHSVAFSGPLAGPEELEVRTGGLSFNNTNWSTDQNVRVIPKRPGTVNLNYVITSEFTRRTLHGTIPLTVTDPPVDTFIPSGEFISGHDLNPGVANSAAQIGYVVKSGAGSLVLAVTSSVTTTFFPAVSAGNMTITGAAGSTQPIYAAIGAAVGASGATKAAVLNVTVSIGGVSTVLEKITFEGLNIVWSDSGAHNRPPITTQQRISFTGEICGYISGCISVTPWASTAWQQSGSTVSDPYLDSEGFVAITSTTLRASLFYSASAGTTYVVSDTTNGVLTGILTVTGTFKNLSGGAVITSVALNPGSHGFSLDLNLSFT